MKNWVQGIVFYRVGVGGNRGRPWLNRRRCTIGGNRPRSTYVVFIRFPVIVYHQRSWSMSGCYCGRRTLLVSFFWTSVRAERAGGSGGVVVEVVVVTAMVVMVVLVVGLLLLTEGWR